MRHTLTIIVLGTVLGSITSSLFASSTTFTGSATFSGPGPTVTYTEIVGPATNPPTPPSIMEQSSPCMLYNGCVVGSFSDALPTIVVPTGDYVTSASLGLYYYYGLGGSPLTQVSVTPIDPNLPTTAGTSGNHSEENLLTFGTAVGSQFAVAGFGNARLFGIDYTTPVQTALLQGVPLAPITVSQDLLYGFKTAQSAFGGQNSYTTFQQTFDLSAASLDAVLTVTFAPVPEPSTLGMLTACLVVTTIALYRRQRSRTRMGFGFVQTPRARA